MEKEKIGQVVVSIEQAVEVQKTGYLHYPPKQIRYYRGIYKSRKAGETEAKGNI